MNSTYLNDITWVKTKTILGGGTNSLTYDHYKKVLNSTESEYGENIGIEVSPFGEMRTYERRRKGLTFFYGKRETLADKINTQPLSL